MSFNKETGMYEGYIYCITNKVNGKQYIGQTTRTIEIRWNQHKRDSKSQSSYFYNALRYFNAKNFNVTEILKITDASKNNLLFKLNDNEIKSISEYNTLCPNGYNLAAGGYNLPNTFPEKSVCQYDTSCNLINKFISVSEASRQTNFDQADISNCCLHKKVKTVGNYIWCFEDDIPSQNIKLKTKEVCQYNYKGKLLNTYISIKQASILTNSQKDNISTCCRGKCITCNGFVWRFKNDSFNKYITPNESIVIQYDINGNFIKRYDSVKQASIATQLRYSAISNVCNGKRHTTGGYIWKYV